MGVVAMNFNDETLAKLEGFASVEKITVSELARQKILDWLEDEEDISDADEVYEQYLKNPESFRNFKELESKWLK